MHAAKEIMPHNIKKLLIVDDSRVSRIMIRTFVLAMHPQWIITESASGDEALQSVEQDKPDYCTMDINMPGIPGTDAAEQIIARHPEIRIAIFSANIQESQQSRSAALGASFVAKPVTEKSVALALKHFEDAA
jgi:DNA-binding NarL/FixJ family response regulator